MACHYITANARTYDGSDMVEHVDVQHRSVRISCYWHRGYRCEHLRFLDRNHYEHICRLPIHTNL